MNWLMAQGVAGTHGACAHMHANTHTHVFLTLYPWEALGCYKLTHSDSSELKDSIKKYQAVNQWISEFSI